MSQGTLFGLIHDLKDRSRLKKIRQAQANYFDDPDAALREVAQYDLDTAFDMRSNEQTYDRNNQVIESGQQTIDSTDRDRYFGALRGVAQGLTRVRDSGGDVQAAYQQMTPVFKSGFGMSDEEIAQWGSAISSDPAVLDQLATFTTPPPEPVDPMNLAPGNVVIDPTTGRVIYRNPNSPKAATLRDGDGGQELYIYDENGNIIGGGSGMGPSASAATGDTIPTQLNIDPTARGVRNNNQGNIKDGPWARRQPGYKGSDGTFAIFETPEAGSAAQENLLRNHYVNGQRSTTDIVMKYLGGANNPENSTASQRNYVGYVAQRLGLDPSAPVPPAMLPQLAQAMREFENGTRAGGGGQGKPIARTSGSSGWRPLSAEEAAERNLDPSRAWQIGMSGANKGKVEPVGNQAPYPKAGAGKPGTTLPEFTSLVSNLERVRDEARGLRNHPSFNDATGSVQGRLPSLRPGTVDFDDKLNAFVSDSVVEALLEMKRLSPNGATGFGAMNKSEGEWLKESEGSFKQTSPELLKKTLTRHEIDAQVSIGMLYNIPPAATKLLLQRPSLAAQFDEQFGKGMAARIMGE